MTIILIMLATALAVAIVFLIGKTSQVARLETENTILRRDSERLQHDLKENDEIWQKRLEKSHNDEIEQRRQFELMASQALLDGSHTMTEHQNHRLEQLLTPLRNELETFRKRVDEVYNHESREIFSLKDQIERLSAESRSVGAEARQLCVALKGSTTVQGNWGEMVLEEILERSGLTKGREFSVQVTRDETGRQLLNESGGRLRPDVVVRYPGGRCVVIDSKVSLTAYMEMTEALTDEDRKEAASRHVTSVKTQMRKLRDKRYADIVGDQKLDFVVMFIPNEGAYIAAMQSESAIWQEAYDSGVLIVSPTHLISMLKLIEQMWRQDTVTRNVMEIAREGGELHHKFVGFITDLQNIDKALESARKAYDKAFIKLQGKGSLAARAKRLETLGAKIKEPLPMSIDCGEEDIDNSLPNT
ncbi:MAG: DNA recombination protein RmuC [Muribaculaceae bacterium]|nr:DNA recombination protein RmuC [Muribaculaceae bacterium]